MRKYPKVQILLVILISLLVGYYFGVNKINFEWKNYQPKVNIASKEPPAGTTNVDFSQFWNVWERISSNYYDKSKIDYQKMLNGAIAGMVGSLEDPFTVYLPPTQNDDFKEGLAGQFQGIGAELGTKDKNIIVIAPLSGSPAQKAGVRAGDIIAEVDGVSTAGWNVSQAVEKIRGPKGTPVTLTVVQNGTDAKDIKIVRDVITVKSVETWLKSVKDIDSVKLDKSLGDRKVAYISLAQFGDNTNSEWLSAVNDLNLKINKNQDVDGIVFDLRNNPGGYLSDAVFIASEFLKEGATVVIEEGGSNGREVMKVNRRGLLTDIPVIILINKGSASASEIVAGALKDNRRATLVGDTSFGKGTIQQAEDLGGGAGLHVTIAKWLTPSETWVNGKGIEPDIAVLLNSKEPERDTQLEKAIQELVE